MSHSEGGASLCLPKLEDIGACVGYVKQQCLVFNDRIVDKPVPQSHSTHQKKMLKVHRLAMESTAIQRFHQTYTPVVDRFIK